MHDLELLAIGSGIVYAIGRALQRADPKQRETIRYTATRPTLETTIAAKLPVQPTRPLRLTNRRYPVRVPVDTTLREEPRNEPVAPRQNTVQPRQPRTRKHTGHGPFGFTQEEMKAARKVFSVGGEAVEYEEAVSNNGWLVGLSEGEKMDDMDDVTEGQTICLYTNGEHSDDGDGHCFYCAEALSDSEGETE